MRRCPRRHCPPAYGSFMGLSWGMEHPPPPPCMYAPHPVEVRHGTPIDQAHGREPGRMFAPGLCLVGGGSGRVPSEEPCGWHGAGSYSVAHRAGLPPTKLTGMWGWILLRSPHQRRGSPPAPAPTQQRPGLHSHSPTGDSRPGTVEKGGRDQGSIRTAVHRRRRGGASPEPPYPPPLDPPPSLLPF